MYRMGIVYVLNNDSLTEAYSLRGCDFNEADKRSNLPDDDSLYVANSQTLNYLPVDKFLANHSLDNTYGVFRTPKCSIINNKEVNPLYFKFTLSTEVQAALAKRGVKGYFFVRQKRLATTLCQGFTMGINKVCHIPMPYFEGTYWGEGFYNKVPGAWKNHENEKEFGAHGNNIYNVADSIKKTENQITVNDTTHSFILSKKIDSRLYTTNERAGTCLMVLDAIVNPTLQSYFNGGSFKFERYAYCPLSRQERKLFINTYEAFKDNITTTSKAIYVPEETKLRSLGDILFSSSVGSAEVISDLGFFRDDIHECMDTDDKKDGSRKDKDIQTNDLEHAMGVELVRGNYAPFIGVEKNLDHSCIYNVKVEGYTEANLKNYFLVRGNDSTAFYAISDRLPLSLNDVSIEAYRGDCFSCTVTIRLNRNFIDNDAPTIDTIIDPTTWATNFRGLSIVDDSDDKADKKRDESYIYTDWARINKADVNNVPLGMWLTYKCLSNYNLGIRSIDSSNTTEMALMSSPRGFYPAVSMSTSSSRKIKESSILNEGYSSTVGQLIRPKRIEVPYNNDQFDNRVMFSDIALSGDTRNGYRIFKPMAHKDIDRQYGAIVKLEPWGNNLLCVFEHGIGVIPINPKALMTTENMQTIHLYGSGVMDSQISPISEDLGSIWPESVVRTPNGVYGVDTAAKKIWFVPLGATSLGQVKCISDMKIQHFLNAHINLKEADKVPIVALRNVKAHFNNFKGDVMFTLYDADTIWNMCWNERQGVWATRYS